MREKGEGLPAGWARTTLAYVTRETIAQTGPQGSGCFVYIDIGSIDNREKRITSSKIMPVAEAPSRAKQNLRSGDVLVSMTRPLLNAVALVSDQFDGAIGSTGFHVLRADGIEPSWLFRAVQTPDFVGAMAEVVQGALYPAVRPKDVRSWGLPLPPLAEQSRIADTLDELFSDLDAGAAALERARAKLKLYRASVLKAAVEGTLTAEWRAQHPDTEPAAELLKRILAERRQRWEEEQLGRYEAKGQAPPMNWKAKYKEPVGPDTEGLPGLPEGWCWATVEQLAAPDKNAITDGPFGSNLKTEHYTDCGPRVIRLQNIKDGTFADERAHISEERFSLLAKHRVFAGDLVIAALGDTLPRSCVLPQSVGPAIVKADCIRFKPNEKISGQCLNFFLNALPTRIRTKKLIHGVGRPRMNLDEIRSILLPLPSPPEQAAIVEIVEDQLSVIDHLEAELGTKLKSAQALRQSILRHAFTGQLVPQDPSDEPAAELLRRIGAEREARERQALSAKGVAGKPKRPRQRAGA